MVVKSDGTKWACLSCLKGHRVSGCTHTDRDLVLVPRKGRPVTQCQHCRQERKKRSAHVKCECGEAEKPHHPKEKCIHLREAEERARPGPQDDRHEEQDVDHLAAVPEGQDCCCHHGGKCSCATLKKSSIDEDGITPHGPAVKPRLESTKSEGHITVFQNGHHKPVHRKNHAAHECGMPYKMPMPRANTDQGILKAARRSVDSLALDAVTPQFGAPFATIERRLSKSEWPSPNLSPARACNTFEDHSIDMLDLDASAQDQTQRICQSRASEGFEFPSLQAMGSMNDIGFDPWSSFPSDDSASLPNNNPFSVWPTNADPMSSTHPALTAASSGTQSESDEFPPAESSYEFGMPMIEEQAGVDFPNFLPALSPQSNRRSLPPNFFSTTDFMSAHLGGSGWHTFLNIPDAGRPKEAPGPSPLDLDDTWELARMPAVTSIPHRPLSRFPSFGKPVAPSIGPRSVPNDDIIQQLFPDIDVNGGNFDAANSPQDLPTGTETLLASNNENLCGSEFGPMENSVDFNSRSWTDDAVDVPVDPFDTSYDLEENFSNPDLENNWSR